MTEERLAEFMECWNTRDVDKLVGFFTEDGVFHGSVRARSPGDDRSRSGCHPRCDHGALRAKSRWTLRGYVCVRCR